MTIRTWILFIAFIAFGCSSAYIAQSEVERANAKQITIDPTARMADRTDPFTLKSFEQNGDILVVNVSYSGGCKPHDFDLVTTGKYKEVYPPEIELKLTHKNNGDGCRSIVDETHYFDLTPLRYEGTNRVKLIMRNTNKTIEYTY